MKKIKKISRKDTIHKGYIFGLTEKDFTKEKFIEGAVIRPTILMLAFTTFIGGMFLLLIGNYKWGGSGIIFSFILNLYAIYESLSDEDSVFRTLNVGFKLVLFLSEIMAFNWVLLQILG
jgi:hypothetical protein